MDKVFFLRGDTPHSLAKRKLLRGTIATVIARRLHNLTVFSNGKYAMTYLDAFAGRGSFGRDDDSKVVSFDYDQVTDWGTPIIAIGVTLDHMKNLTERDTNPVTQTVIESLGLDCLKTIKFHFNDYSRQNIADLRKKIDEGLKKEKWQIFRSRTLNKYEQVVEFIGPFLTISQSIKIYYTTYKFEEMSFLKQLQPPLFSLIDPFGISQIPMSSVSLLIGSGKEVFINLMVATVNRSIHNERHKLTVKSLFGREENSFEKEFDSKNSLNQKLLNLCSKYQNRLKEVSSVDPLYTSAFAFRKGKSNPNCGTMFYMVLGTDSLSILNDHKRAMQKFTQFGSEPAFSDYFSFRGIVVPEGRKTTESEEAQTIFDHFIRIEQPVTLGEVKRFIIEDTRYPYHANSLKYLEKEKRLTVESNDEFGNPIVRNRKELCYKVSKHPNDTDWYGQKFGNFWLLSFHQKTETKTFPNQNNRIERKKRSQETPESKKQATKRMKRTN